MLKKAHKSSTENSCSRKDWQQCSACKNHSTKTMLSSYVCESGHVVCMHCQPDDDVKQSRRDNGDCWNKVQTNYKINEVHQTIKQHKSDIIQKVSKDFASGDCDKRVNTMKLKGKSKSEHKIKSIGVNDLVKSDNKAEHIETTVEYKNVNFKDNKSSGSDTSTPSLLDFAKKIVDSEETLMSQACPRPVVCPVLDCGKTIAMSSAMQHFYYDHPKLPRLMLMKGISQDTLLKVDEIKFKTQCLNIFLLQEKECCGNNDRKLSSMEILKHNFAPLLLMSARMLTKQFKSESNKKHYTKRKVDKNILDNRRNIFKENEMLLLWVCKLEEPPIRYSITLISKDKKHGRSYIGESIHIRNDQDALAIFHVAESLVIHGPALNKILDNGQLCAILNVLD